MLFVSHDAAAVRALCSRAILLRAGSVIAEGKPADVLNLYQKIIMEREQAYDAESGALKSEPTQADESLAPVSYAYRHGDGSAEIIGAELTDANHSRVEIVESGEPLTLRMVVRFHHDCDDRMLLDAYRRALCVVLPSVYKTPDGQETKVPELLGQTLLEAMACGTPVICTRVASMPEIVDDGRTGFIVEGGDRCALGDRLRWLREHPSEAAAMGSAGRIKVLERFQWTQVVQRCLDAYSSVTSNA